MGMPFKKRKQNNRKGKRFKKIDPNQRGNLPCKARLPHDFDTIVMRTQPETSFNPSDIDRLINPIESKVKFLLENLKTIPNVLANLTKSKKLLKKKGIKFNNVDFLKATNFLTK